MATIPEALAIAIQHHQNGRLQAAEQIYRQILAAEPQHADALHLLGLLAHQAGKPAEAAACYRRALDLKPNFAEGQVNLGIALQEQGQFDAAAACHRRALELKPDYADALGNLGVVLMEQGKLDEAAACWRRALELKPGYAQAHNNLGVVLKEQGRFAAAAACYRRALELEPGYAQAHNNLGVALKEQGKLDEAVACCRRALELNPRYAHAHNNLGVALKEQGNLDEAVACCRRALELEPDFVAAHNNLGNALKELGRLDEALACYRHALELNPDYAEAWNNLGNVLKDQAKLDEAVAAYRRALELDPRYTQAHSNLLFALQYCPEAAPAALFQAHAEYDRRHAAPLKAVAKHETASGRRQRSRLGFVSADLGRHPVGYFLVRVLECLGPAGQETICYSDRVLKDDLTHRLQAAATLWRDAIGWSDEQLAEQIRADRIDVLFDLAGHTAHNRLLVFARRPAPLQVTWAGYVGTTGLQTIDYLLADRYEVPPGAERYYQERLLRMPDGYVCYDPPDYAPAVGPLPALNDGSVTFGCFNNPAKVTAQAVEVWSRILHRLPGARLVLKFKCWDDRGLARRFTEMFAAHAIDPGRLEFLGYSPHAQLLAEYNRIDLALDPFPYSGGLTTCEALWMGVPVVTCPGETFAGRHSLSHLSNVGLTETIAQDLDDYVERAVSLAGDLPRLAALRTGLRPRMAASPLCDGQRFVANLVSVLLKAWEQRTN